MSAGRQLGLFSATSIVVASMIGTGVFTTSGFLLADLKSPGIVLLAWTVGGGLAALGALCYGALARRYPESGGEYLFLSETLHPAAGYLAGWVSLLVGFSAPVAAAALAFGEYTQPWFPYSTREAIESAATAAALRMGWDASNVAEAGRTAMPRILGTLLLAAFTVIHSQPVRRGASIQNIAVLLKVGFIVAFVVVAARSLPPINLALPAASEVSLEAFAVSLVWISFSYSGWNAAVYIAGDIRDPERNLPRALLLGTGLVTILYLALNAVFVLAAPASQLAGKLEVGRIAARALGGQTLANVVTALVAVVLISSVSSMIMAGPRVYARMAADGYLPAWLRAHDGPPRATVRFQTALAWLLLWTSAFESLLTYIGFTLSLSAATTVAGLVRIRIRDGESVRIPGWPWTPAAFLVSAAGSLGFVVMRKPMESAIGLCTLFAGLLAWWASSRRKTQGLPGL